MTAYRIPEDCSRLKDKAPVSTTWMVTQLKCGSLKVGPTSVDNDVADVGRASESNVWSAGEFCGKDIFNIWIVF